MKNWFVPITLISGIVGLLMAVQFRAQASFGQGLPSRRLEDLVVLMKDAELKNHSLTVQADTLRKQLENVGAGGKAIAVPERWGSLQGPGVELSIDDSAKPLAKGENPNIAIVHNEDLLRIVNELKASGAEAISINDQRLIETSEISCAGPTILVNKSRIVPPFIIRAIGDSDTMMAALQLRGGILEYLQFYGIQVNITKKPNVLVPMYHGGEVYTYAKPITGKHT